MASVRIESIIQPLDTDRGERIKSRAEGKRRASADRVPCDRSQTLAKNARGEWGFGTSPFHPWILSIIPGSV